MPELVVAPKRAMGVLKGEGVAGLGTCEAHKAEESRGRIDAGLWLAPDGERDNCQDANKSTAKKGQKSFRFHLRLCDYKNRDAATPTLDTPRLNSIHSRVAAGLGARGTRWTR